MRIGSFQRCTFKVQLYLFDCSHNFVSFVSCNKEHSGIIPARLCMQRASLRMGFCVAQLCPATTFKDMLSKCMMIGKTSLDQNIKYGPVRK